MEIILCFTFFPVCVCVSARVCVCEFTHVCVFEESERKAGFKAHSLIRRSPGLIKVIPNVT